MITLPTVAAGGGAHQEVPEGSVETLRHCGLELVPLRSSLRAKLQQLIFWDAPYEVVAVVLHGVRVELQGFSAEYRLGADVHFRPGQVDDEVTWVEVLVVLRIDQDVGEWGGGIAHIRRLGRAVDDVTDKAVDRCRQTVWFRRIYASLIRFVVDYQDRAIRQ